MAPPDQTSVKEAQAPTKDAEAEKEDVSTLRSPSLYNNGVGDVNQELNRRLNKEANRGVNQQVNQGVKKRPLYKQWSKREETIVQDIIDNHSTNPATSKMDFKELDRYSVKKLAEAGFVRTLLGVTDFRGRNLCKIDYSKVCDLVANMPESIRDMEAREGYGNLPQWQAILFVDEVQSLPRVQVSYESLFNTNHSEPLASSQEWNTLSRIMNSQFARNGKRDYEEYNSGLAGESSTNAAAAAAATQKPQAQTFPMGTNGQQGFPKTPGTKSCEVAKMQSETGLNMPPASKRMCVTNNSKENPIEIRDDSPLSQSQSESDRIELARGSIANLEKMTLSCLEIKMWCEMSAVEYEAKSKEAVEMAAKYKKKAIEKLDEILKIHRLNPEFKDYKPFQ
ncbi:hypothetical protein BPOR_0154g00070 [Botrytis porri]|uniref:Uncharacterized protein n=1 Tax=Botrytis porri TaxID=87229 RepID=A0A4Z1KVN2_9HELO|nr:hypothetical protein BPOR_0154g00070 [Botrytis porri]